MPEPTRPRPDFHGYRTYFCARCKRNVAIVGKQEQPNFHRVNKNGTGPWCVAPGNSETVTHLQT